MNMKEIYNRFKTYLVEQDLKVPAEMEKDLEGPMPSPKDSSESNLQRAIRTIEADGFDYKVAKNQIRVLDDNRVETMDKLIQILSPLGFVHNPIGGGSSIGRLDLIDRQAGSVYIYVKPKTRKSAAAAGMDFELKLANQISQRYEDLGITAVSAGSGHGSDLSIMKNGQTVLTVELKTALAADFGQFRIQFNLNTGKWEPRRTKGYIKNEPIFEPLFEDNLLEWLNINAQFPDVNDPRLNRDKNNKISGLKRTQNTGKLKRELENLWFDGKTDIKVPFDFSHIANYYSDKGDSFIQINGRGLYALTPEAQEFLKVPMFRDLGLTSELRFRFKPSTGVNSPTSFTCAVKIKGRYQKSNLSLTNEQDLDKIISML
jgi:hypothetical protein